MANMKAVAVRTPEQELIGAHDYAALMERLADQSDEISGLSLQLESASAEMQRWNMFDTVGWELLNAGEFDERGVPLEALKRWAPVNQQLVAINPMVKRGVQIRVSYIFGEGVLFGSTDPGRKPQDTTPPKADAPTKAGTPAKAGEAGPLLPAEPKRRKRKTPADTIVEKNKHIFSAHGYEQQEIAAATDGNLIYLLDPSDKSIVRVPFNEIVGITTRAGDRETKLYMMRQWTETESGDATDPTTTKKVFKAWYPIVGTEHRNNELGKSIKFGGEAVKIDRTKAILHIAVNDQVGWLWGVPDLQSVLFWAKAYKETLEANYTLVRALAKFTWKITNTTPAQTKRAAQRVATQAVLDPITGRPMTAGGTAITPGDTDMVAINKAGANVNFDAARPLAAMVAAGLEVSLIELLSDPSIGNQASAASLGIPTLKAMTRRQAIFRDAYKAMFDFFGANVDPTFPPIQSEAIHRVIQAVVTAASTNALHPEEIREMLILALRQVGINPMDVLPLAGQYAKYVTGIDAQAALDAQNAAAADAVNNNAGTSPQSTPKGAAKGKGRQPAGKTADGDHEQRKSEAMRGLLEAFGVDPADMQD